MAPSISCIVPAYNSSRYLAEALDSILAQTLPVSEIIVIDDGSTDTTPDIARGYGERVTYVRQQNAGPANARNRGLSLAKGDFFSFLDADDLWRKDKLELQMRALDANPAAGMCVSHVQNFWIEELAAERDRLRDHPFAKPVVGYVCQCLLARRSVFDTVGGFNEAFRLSEDTDWYLRAERAGIVKEVVTETLVYRRIHGLNLSYEMWKSAKARTDLLDNVIGHLKHRRNRTP